LSNVFSANSIVGFWQLIIPDPQFTPVTLGLKFLSPPEAQLAKLVTKSIAPCVGSGARAIWAPHELI